MKYCSIAPCTRFEFKEFYCLNHWRNLYPLATGKNWSDKKPAISNTNEWKTWYNMLFRCYSPKSNSYKNYGGRGITVCQRWIDDYQNFIDDMGYKPTPHHSIDRINNDGNYEPSNCRWSTRSEQARNRRPKAVINQIKTANCPAG